MCGIGGIVGFKPETDIASRIEILRKNLAHRGPDDSGSYFCTLKKCALVHTRLSIQDLSAAGRQPMGTEDGRFQICFNGEIYNFKKLRSQLSGNGVVFRSNSDTEVLLHLYARDGAKMLGQLEGMYAFAIWDTLKQQLFLARDPLGIKPLYYWINDDGQIAFASEFRALLSIKLGPKKLCLDSVGRFLRWGSVQEPDTLVQGIKQLPAGHHLVFKDGSSSIAKHWSVSFGSIQRESDDDVRLVREGLTESIQRHFVADVPVGLFLSGGIDSTAIAALAGQLGYSRLKSFCISFDDPVFDEGDVAKKTAEHFGTEHHDWRMSATDGRQLFHEFVDCMDQPSNDGLNTYCVSKFAKRMGVKVVLSGLGGDELFGGYPSFSVVPKLVKFRKRFGSLAQIVGKFIRLSTQPGFLGFKQRLQVRRVAEYLAGSGTDLEAYWAMRGFFSTSEAASVIEDLLGVPFKAETPWLGQAESPLVNSGNVVGIYEIEKYMRNQLLRDSDVMSMANGQELRVPFVDRKFVDIVNSVRPERRYLPNKQLLLQAVPEIPQWVWQKNKKGFRFPLEKWVREDWSADFEEIEKNTRVRLFSWYRKWTVFVLRRFIDRHGLVA